MLANNKPMLIWTRQHDVDLIIGTYNHGYGALTSIQSDPSLLFSTFTNPYSPHPQPLSPSVHPRLHHLISLLTPYINSPLPSLASRPTTPALLHHTVTAAHLRPLSGLTLPCKLALYSILVDYGVPVTSGTGSGLGSGLGGEMGAAGLSDG